MLGRVKFLIMTVISGLGAIYIALQAYRKGKQAGAKAVIKEVHRAEQARQEKQERINAVHHHAVQEALDVHSDTSVDRFNQLFHDRGDSP
ncbi:hypothetical protein PVA45_08260 (plasmid) [Entomospira entomophila]|uniref:Uncharacterized protein n=1 Tax=Entomospira entomophila TaxID=2719988 RepID=A0A968KSB1_9SPIO|nr:hypothetical protein [Entomospira entomophilus]NIZ41549.1 hypothetical protein [Entomospira entomophilus]WDI36423.1 hypothetical protein PVA45_08260 [Entomospira entomophilus]